LLAALLHAAALGGRDMSDLMRWIALQTEDEPTDILKASGSDAALIQLQGVLKHDSRNRSTNYISTGNLLGAYRYPQVQAVAKSGFSADDFLDGGAHTLYLCASEHHQKLLAPIIVMIITSILQRARELSRQGQPRKPYLRMLLDETAQIAQLPNLPGQLAEARAHGVRFATVWQSVAQIEQRYKRDADTILASSTTKLFMGPITDRRTRETILGQLGDQPDPNRPGARRPIGTAQELAQLQPGRGLLFAGTNIPAITTLPGYGDIEELAPRTSNTWHPDDTRRRSYHPLRWLR
jgi:type IV secretion system protein VirD4